MTTSFKRSATSEMTLSYMVGLEDISGICALRVADTWAYLCNDRRSVMFPLINNDGSDKPQV